MTTSANLDLVRSIYAAWERGDFGSVEWAHPAIETSVADGPEPGASTGVAGMVKGLSTILDAWEDWRPEVEEYRELDNERILVLTHRVARGKTSRLQVHSKGANLFHLRGGKVIGIVHYWERERALADLGRAGEADASEASS